MRELVFKSEKGTPVTNSLLVAEKFEKRHADVIRAIEDLLSQIPDNQRERNFALTYNEKTMPNRASRRDPLYAMTRDGFSLLVMGFTGKKALKFKLDFIEAFNKMEQVIKSGGFQVPTSFREALLLAAEQQEVIEAQKRQIDTQKPKVLFADSVAGSQQSCLIKGLSVILAQNGVEIGQNRLFEWLRKNGYLCNVRGERYNQPTQKALDLGVIEIKKTSITKPSGTFIMNTPVVTGKGQIYFVNKFLKVKEVYHEKENIKTD